MPAGADVVPPEPVSAAARAAARAEASAASGTPGAERAPSRVGQGGVETWRFEAVAPGRTQIELVYVRPWESDVAPARWAIYSVEVR
jgi:predicted secreted protein